MEMNDKTFNFMMYLKIYRPKAHDHLISMTYLGVNSGRYTVKKIFHTYGVSCKFPWKVNDVNVFQLRADLINETWKSKTWGKLIQGESVNQ